MLEQVSKICRYHLRPTFRTGFALVFWIESLQFGSWRVTFTTRRATDFVMTDLKAVTEAEFKLQIRQCLSN